MKAIIIFGVFLNLWLWGAETIASSSWQLSTLEEVLEAFEESNGGRQSFERIKSLRVTGVIIEEEAEYTFTLFKKRPNLAKLIIEDGPLKIYLTFDGEQTWQQVFNSATGKKTETVLLKNSVALSFKRQAFFDSPLLLNEDSDHQLELVGIESINGRNCYRVEVEDFLGESFTLYLDAVTFQEIAQRKIKYLEEGEQETLVLHEEFKKVRDVWFAFKTQKKRSGKTYSEIRIEEINVNVGVFDSFFKISSPSDKEEIN